MRRAGWLLWLPIAAAAGCDVAHVRLLDDQFGPHAGTGGSAGTGTAAAGAGAGAGGMSSAGQAGAQSGGQAGGGQGGASPCTAFGAWAAPEPVQGLGQEDTDHFGPSLTNEPTVLFYSVGRDDTEDIWRAPRAGLNDAFTGALAVTEVNTATMDGTPFIMPDGQALWFSSTREGGLGDRDIWMAPGGVNGFAAAINVSEVNTDGLEHLPSLTADGLILVFGSTRVDSANEDIFMATRNSVTEPFQEPFYVTELNTTSYDSSAAITADGLTIYFASKRNGDGASGTDIFFATRDTRDEPFNEPQEVSELNSLDNDEDPRLSPAGNEIFFASNRDTGVHQIWHSLRECVDP